MKIQIVAIGFLIALFTQNSFAETLIAPLNQNQIDPILLGNDLAGKVYIILDLDKKLATLTIEKLKSDPAKTYDGVFTIQIPIDAKVASACDTEMYLAKLDLRAQGKGRQFLQINDNSKATCKEGIYAPTEVTLILKPQDYPRGHTMYSKFYGPVLKPKSSFFSNSTKI